MSIDDIRMNQRSQQSSAIKSRREIEGVVRIGDRDPVTGRYQVLEPDGGIDPNGIKVFNSQEQYGDRVLPFRRIDGTIGLDSEKGSKARPPTAFPKCPGYLGNQVFNCEEPKPVPKNGFFWILFIYENRLYVGGHKREPELIYDPIPAGIANTTFSALPVNVQNNIYDIYRYAQIWGDSQGWEASYGIKTPVSLVVFAVEGESKNSPSYTRDDQRISYDRLNRLGKGLYIRFNSTESYTQDNVAGTTSSAWESTIADFDGAPKGRGSKYDKSGFGSINFVYTTRNVESYPSPYSSKGENFASDTFSKSRLLNGSVFFDGSGITETNTNSCAILYRDRSQALFSRVNSQYTSSTTPDPNRVFSGSAQATIDYIVSDGQKDTVLFSLPSQSITTPGDRPNTSIRSFSGGTFNFPVITSIDGLVKPDPAKANYNHLDSQEEYKVRVYSVLSKSSFIDGSFTTVTLSAWGIPLGAQVLDTASYVGDS